MTGTIFTEGYIPADSLADLFIHSDSNAKCKERQIKIWKMKASLKKGTGTCTQTSNTGISWQVHSTNSIHLACRFTIQHCCCEQYAQRKWERKWQNNSMLVGEVPWKQKALKWHVDASKALPAQHPLGTGHELATGISTAVAEDTQINPTSSPLFWLQQLQTNVLQRGKKKGYFPGLHISVSVKLQSASWGGKRAMGRPSEVLLHPCRSLSGFSKPFLPPAANL